MLNIYRVMHMKWTLSIKPAINKRLLNGENRYAMRLCISGPEQTVTDGLSQLARGSVETQRSGDHVKLRKATTLGPYTGFEQFILSFLAELITSMLLLNRVLESKEYNYLKVSIVIHHIEVGLQKTSRDDAVMSFFELLVYLHRCGV